MNSESELAVPPLERLIAIEEVRRVKARYWRGLDTEDWDLFASVFTTDVTVDFREAYNAEGSETAFPHKLRGEVIHGLDTWVEVVKRGRAARNQVGSVSMHHGHMPEIDILSPSTARAIWAMEDMVFWPGKGTTHGFGYYHEAYEKIDGAWKIKHVRLQRLRVGSLG